MEIVRSRVKYLGLLAGVTVALISGCQTFPSVVFQDGGVGDTNTALFTIDGGTYAMRYGARDRDPGLGCEFGADVVSQPADPLALGVTVVERQLIRVQPRSSVSGQITWPPLLRGTYYLRTYGHCDWDMQVIELAG